MLGLINVLKLVNGLCKNGGLYQDEGIQLNPQWVSQFQREQNIDVNEDVQDSQLGLASCNNTILDDSETSSEEETEINAGVTDTMLTVTDFFEDNERVHILNVAPAEGNTPLSIFRDKHSKELAYPGIFLGQPRPESKSVHYSDIRKSELRRLDRRAALCV